MKVRSFCFLNELVDIAVLTMFGSTQSLASPSYAAFPAKASSGKGLLIGVAVLGAGILIGMALGLGLGIGAAGIVSSSNLINVTNTTTV